MINPISEISGPKATCILNSDGYYQKWKWRSLGDVWLFVTPWAVHGIQNTRVGSFSLLQGIFPTQESNPGLPHCRGSLYQLSYQGSSAAAAAKSLLLCPTLCDPIDGSPPGSPVPGILQARTLEWVAISCSSAWQWEVKVKSLSRVWLLAIPWTAAYQAPPSMEVSRQEYWSGSPVPFPGYYQIATQMAIPTYILPIVQRYLFFLTSLPMLDVINSLYLYHEREYIICIFSLVCWKFVFLTKISAISLYSCFYWIFTFIFLICRSALFLIAIDLLFHKLQNFYTCMIFKFFCTFYYCAQFRDIVKSISLFLLVSEFLSYLERWLSW